MKKIFKVFLVFLIAVNFLFSNTVKTKALEYKYPKWAVSYGAIHQTTKEWFTEDGGWIDGVNSVAYGISLPEGYAIYNLIIVFDIGELTQGNTVNLTYDLEIGGIRPLDYGVIFKAWAVSEGVRFEIPVPTFENSDEYFEQSNTDSYGFINRVKNYKYTNDTDMTVNCILFELDLRESKNILYVLTQFHELNYYITKSDAVIDAENNENIGGILETVKGIFNGIINLPINIANSVSGFFDNVVNSVMNIGNMITNGLTTLGNFIIDGLKSLFIPSDQFFKNYFDSLYDFFSDKLGILIMPIDILGSLMDNILNLGNGDGFIHVPDIKFMDKTLIPKTDYNLKQDVQQVMGNYYDMYYLLTDVIIYFMLFNMAKKKFDEIVRGAK